MTGTYRIRELLDRLARLSAAEEWSEDLNPAQRGALAYLARANRFSRAPSHVADYLCTTRGTASQTLKALDRKGFIEQTRHTSDRRSVAYSVTESGQKALTGESDLNRVIDGLSQADAKSLTTLLEDTLRGALSRRGGRSFGLCHTCQHHQPTSDGLHCRLLNLPLAPTETQQICHEHQAA